MAGWTRTDGDVNPADVREKSEPEEGGGRMDAFVCMGWVDLLDGIGGLMQVTD